MKLDYNDIELILHKYHQRFRGMNNFSEVNGILRKLVDILNNNIDGDIVELGCNNGGTSYWIQIILQLYDSKKKFHVYDSWQGVPEKNENDYLKNSKIINDQIVSDNNIRTINEQIDINENYWKKGACQCNKIDFIKTFEELNTLPPIQYKDKIIDIINLPIIHNGFFIDIPDNEYPEKISFAFFDGDFYSSIMDSFNKVYYKCVKDSIIVIDDCGDNTLIGVKNACIDFLSDKNEELHFDAYPDSKGNWDRSNSLNSFPWGGWIKKI